MTSDDEGSSEEGADDAEVDRLRKSMEQRTFTTRLTKEEKLERQILSDGRLAASRQSALERRKEIIDRVEKDYRAEHDSSTDDDNMSVVDWDNDDPEAAFVIPGLDIATMQFVTLGNRLAFVHNGKWCVSNRPRNEIKTYGGQIPCRLATERQKAYLRKHFKGRLDDETDEEEEQNNSDDSSDNGGEQDVGMPVDGPADRRSRGLLNRQAAAEARSRFVYQDDSDADDEEIGEV